MQAVPDASNAASPLRQASRCGWLPAANDSAGTSPATAKVHHELGLVGLRRPPLGGARATTVTSARARALGGTSRRGASDGKTLRADLRPVQTSGTPAGPGGTAASRYELGPLTRYTTTDGWRVGHGATGAASAFPRRGGLTAGPHRFNSRPAEVRAQHGLDLRLVALLGRRLLRVGVHFGGCRERRVGHAAAQTERRVVVEDHAVGDDRRADDRPVGVRRRDALLHSHL